MTDERPQQTFAFDASPLADADTVQRILQQWVDMEWLRPLDLSLVQLLAREAQQAGQPADPLLLMAVALASHQLGRGHVCLDLATLNRQGYDALLSLPPENEEAPENRLLPSEVLLGVAEAEWDRALEHPLLVAKGEAADEDDSRPLVRDGLRLYLRRYWQYERTIARHIAARLQRQTALQAADSPQAGHLSDALTRLFGPAGSGETTDWQRVACANAARRGFSVITGGPGTGKTTTVVRMLAALQHVALSQGEGARERIIRLAAPTGKAAARLNESIAGAVDSLDLDAFGDAERLRRAILTEVTTLHRLMGSIPGSRHFRHNRQNPLLLDVLVIDEASMVDVEMMAQMLDALPEDAQLILLGDKDQLASVDAGAVLGDLCQRAGEGGYWPQTADWLNRVAGERIDAQYVDAAGGDLEQGITLLRHSYRFDAHSGIGQLATAVNRAGQSTSPADVSRLFDAGYPDIARVPVPRDPAATIRRQGVTGSPEAFPNAGEGRQDRGQDMPPPVGYAHYLTRMRETRPAFGAEQAALDAWAREVLRAHNQFQMLCALRRGTYGVEGLNEQVAGALHEAGLIPATESWYAGRPVLVTRNDYSVGLMNGDIGITLALPTAPGERPLLRVAFPANDGSGRIKWVLPSRLHAVETVYAMTVHKSQGSEFVHTCLVLPERSNPVLTRELVYTGITRARHWFSLLVPDDGVFREAIGRGVTRTSGLRVALEK
ncbi:exodeoxyribonuclease V subunit alpha [Marinobacter sp. JSM 1782161]|uniref:exodeoxyribonuclease V subunit alpha n=1 Tax=Marinobacter sp. JSM 1782161 TaxID=2685906 RepID=UPI001403CF71|nr:exodeoxyribonuclease V subunit alpha [Marinobacter sp. JSM 1782161]